MESGLKGAGRESLAAVKVAAERARGLTGQLLAFSRRQEMRLEVVDLQELVQAMTDMLARTLAPRHLREAVEGSRWRRFT